MFNHCCDRAPICECLTLTTHAAFLAAQGPELIRTARARPLCGEADPGPDPSGMWAIWNS